MSGERLTKAQRAVTPLGLAATMLREMGVELDLWRERYPHMAPFIHEEARATVEGREPRRLPPVVLGAAPAGRRALAEDGGGND